MFELNLPSYNTNIRKEGSKTQIYDILRRRFVALTPEEWVRQHFIHYLITQKGYPQALLANEFSITLNGTTRRCDSVLYNNQLTPLMIIEYKAPNIKITQKVFQQIWSYNTLLHVPYLIVSNGMEHFCCYMNYTTQKVEFLQEIPPYSALNIS